MPRRSSSTPSTPAMESRRQGLQGWAAGGSGGTAVNSRNAAMIDVRNASGGRGPGLPRVPRCRPCRLSRDAVDTYDGRFEYWDAATETAWGVAEPTCTRWSPACGAVPSSAAARSISSGTRASRTRRRILRADEVGGSTRDGRGYRTRGLDLGAYDRPDVVLEVDHTADVHQGKLDLYAAWRFPEVWVDVPDVAVPSRPAGCAPRLTAIGSTARAASRPGRRLLAGPRGQKPFWRQTRRNLVRWLIELPRIAAPTGDPYDARRCDARSGRDRGQGLETLLKQSAEVPGAADKSPRRPGASSRSISTRRTRAATAGAPSSRSMRSPRPRWNAPPR